MHDNASQISSASSTQEFPALMPRPPRQPEYHGGFTIPERSRKALQQYEPPEDQEGHSRTVSMPNIPTNSPSRPRIP